MGFVKNSPIYLGSLIVLGIFGLQFIAGALISQHSGPLRKLIEHLEYIPKHTAYHVI